MAASLLVAGPIVATIFVRRMKGYSESIDASSFIDHRCTL
jgi:hypothetical protein